MGERHYTILLHPCMEAGFYWVTVPSPPGCVTQGDTIGEAIRMAHEAITLHIEGLMEDGKEIPEDDIGTQAITISVAA